MLIGYARVSTDEQNLAMQLDALGAAGCSQIFCDEGISGAETDRRELNNALRTLTTGDVLVVWKLDRLGRSLAHLIQITTRLQEEAIGFRSLSEGSRRRRTRQADVPCQRRPRNSRAVLSAIAPAPAWPQPRRAVSVWA
jgi:DNA invertase Pin-like site-specific DNA recombinase